MFHVYQSTKYRFSQINRLPNPYLTTDIVHCSSISPGDIRDFHNSGKETQSPQVYLAFPTNASPRLT